MCVIFVTSVIMVSGIDKKPSLVVVIGHLENGSESARIERHDPMLGIT